MVKEDIMQAIQALRVHLQEIRKKIIEEGRENPPLSKEDYAIIANYLNIPLHQAEIIKRIATRRSN